MHYRPSPLHRAILLASLLGAAAPLVHAAGSAAVELHIAPRSLDSAAFSQAASQLSQQCRP